MSKIPNDASHYRVDRCEHTTYYRWFDGHLVIWGDGQWVYTGETELPEGAQSIQDLTPAPAWDGKGLPPVGTVCEIDPNQSHDDYYAHHAGKPIHIVVHGVSSNGKVPTAVYWVMGDDGFKEYHALVAGNFRPIRTPEQIERDVQISDMIAISGLSTDDSTREALGKLYDLGWRTSKCPST